MSSSSMTTIPLINQRSSVGSSSSVTSSGGQRFHGNSSSNATDNTKKRISIQQVNHQPNPQSFVHHKQQQKNRQFSGNVQQQHYNYNASGNSAGGVRSNHLPLQQQHSSNSFRPFSTASGCVAFQYETDGRSTFPTQRDFHDFCKQRDLFYGIKEIWTTQQSDQHQLSPANANTYDPAFGKMKTLFQLNSNPTNMNRLATLFLSQCILDSVFCANQANKTDEASSAGGDPRVNHVIANQTAENSVRKILQSNPSKLEQLRNRVAPNPEASAIDFVQINDPMAFLKYFIGSVASAPSFTQYLIDHAIHELSEIENTIESEGPQTDSKEILELIQKTTLLGKMLGYLYFLPYKSKLNVKSTAISYEQQAALRSYQTPPLDLHSIIVKSFRQNRIVGTLPWVIELLSQADPATQYLPKYKSTFKLISLLYHNYLPSTKLKSTEESIKDCPIGFENRRFLRLYIENLLGSNIFIQEEIPDNTADELITSMMPTHNLEPNELTDEHLDSQNFIGSTLIPICFPSSQQLQEKPICLSVDEFPPLLRYESVPDSPFPDRVPQNRQNLTSKNDAISKIQELLETQFYKMHPTSMKKTIEFVAERIASNFVKNLRSHLLLTIKQELISGEIFLEDAVKICKERIKVRREEFCSLKCKESLRVLLDDNFSEGVKSTCFGITVRKANDKISKWVDQHVKKDLFPITEPLETPEAIEPEPLQMPRQELKTEPLESLHREGQLPFQCLILLKLSLKKLHSNKQLHPDSIDQIVHSISQIHNYKPWIKNSIINFLLALITFQPESLTDKLQVEFIQTWKLLFWDADDDSSKILCSRNLILFTQSNQPAETWSKFGSFLKHLVDKDLISVDMLHNYCVTVLLRQDWPLQISEHISTVLKSLKLPVSDSSGEASVINWVEWFYSGREDENF